MAKQPGWVPHGVIPAVLLPFNEDLSIDEASYRSHLRDVCAVEGISALTTNAHASEVASCSFEEQRRVLAITVDEAGARMPVVNGVYAENALEAARIARMAHDGGASALLVFPSGVFTFGQRPEMAIDHFRRIADASDLPLILFQYPLAGGQGYPLSTLSKILDAVPTVRAIKDWCSNPQLHERHVRLLQSRSPAVNDRIWPTAEVFYSEPWVDMHNRMKEALVLLGKLPRATVRPPLAKLAPAEIERVRRALVEAGLLADEQRAKRVA